MSEHRSDHERIGPLLASHERAWSLRAHEHEEAAERAKETKRRVMASQPNIPDEARGRLEGHHDHEIATHERQAKAHRRRAEHAAAGFLLDGPDERTDAEYQKAHAELIGMAHRTGRVRHTEESLDD